MSIAATEATVPTANPIKIHDARDLLAAVPYLLGYHPSDCVLVVCIHPGGTLGLLARTALSDLVTMTSRANAADLVARRAREDGTASAFVITYCERQTPATAAAAFSTALATMEIPSESWHVGAATYRNLDCADEICCPQRGFPLTMLQSSEVGARMVVSGVAPAASRDQAYQIRAASELDRNQARRASRSWLDIANQARRCDREELSTWRNSGFGLWNKSVRAVVAGSSVAAARAGQLAAAMSDTRVRDAILLTCLPDGDDIARQLLAGAETSAVDVPRALSDVLASVVAPEDALVPDREALVPRIRLLEFVASLSPRKLRPAPLAILALLAWWLGDGGRAGYRITSALRIDPKNQLALLIHTLVEEGVPPGWIRARATSSVAEFVRSTR